MEEVFPILSRLPPQVSVHLQKMIDWLDQARLQGGLSKFRYFEHIYEVLDSDGNVRCLFKAVRHNDEQSARNEACVYLLDHPENGHRSECEDIYGFSGVLPTLFVRFKIGTETMSGVLLEFIEAKENEIVPHCAPAAVSLEEIHKILVADLRFGNMDRNPDNLLLRENNSLVPIDHELTFSNDYNICGPCWLRWLRRNEEPFSPRFVNYVRQLDADRDIQFLRLCRWEPGVDYLEKFKVFNIFLRLAVSQGLTAFQAGTIASCKCDDMKFNLQNMVDGVTKDERFFESVESHLQELLSEYHKRI